MKHKLLSLMALIGVMFSSTGAWAQTELPDPKKPVQPVREAFNGTWVDPVAGSTYYIYNTGAAQFMGTGNDWGTRTVLTTDSIVAPNGTTIKVETNKNYVVPFAIEAVDGEDYYYIRTLMTDKGNGAYVTGEGNASWIDGGKGDRAGKWQFVPTTNANEYMFHCANQFPYDATNVNAEDAAEYMDYWRLLGVVDLAAGTYTWNDSKIGVNWAGNPYLVNWKFIEATDEVAQSIRDWREATTESYKAATDKYNEDMAVYNALVDLKNAIAEGEEAGVDVADGISTYNNPDATLEEIKKAAGHIRALIKGQQYDFNGASESNPLDVTDQVLVNPNFDTDINGWTITVGGQNLQWQNRVDGKTDESQNWVTINAFIEAWISQNQGLGDGTISQTIYGLPKGKYILECDAMATRQGGLNGKSAEDAVEGAYIFIQGDESEVREPIKSPDKQPKHWSVVFISNGDDAITFGLKVESTTANWISADNFKLTYFGETTKSQEQLALEATIATAEALAPNISEVGNNDIEAASYIYNVSNEVGTAFNSALETAKSIVESGSSEEIKAADEALKSAMDAVKKSNAVYQQYQQVYNNALNTVSYLAEKNQWSELQQQIGTWAEGELTDAFTNGTLTEEGLAEAQEKVHNMVVEFVGDGSSIQAGDDLTLLVQNADFNIGQYGRSADDKTNYTGNIPGWSCTSGDITELSGTYHNIEAFHKAFDFNQTIKNMPAGAYRVTVQGFVRLDSGEKNMVLYAGASEKKFKSITEESSAEPLLYDPENPSSTAWPYDVENTELGGYIPNSMQGAGIYFENINPTTGEPFYLNDVSIVHTGGDLTIGVRSTGNNQWILWDNFTLTYEGSDAISVILDEIQEQWDELDELVQNSVVTTGTQTALDETAGKVDAKDNITEMDEATALLNEIKALGEQAKADNKAYEELMAMYNAYQEYELEEGYTATDEYNALKGEIDDHIYNEDFENIEQIQNYMKVLPVKFHQPYVNSAMEGAETGSDVSSMILNSDFELQNANHWTLDTSMGDNVQYQAKEEGYTNSETGLQVLHFVEAWANGTALKDGEISQVLGVLPEGWYQLEVDGYAVNQASEPEDGVQGGYLFARVGEEVSKASMAITGTTGQPAHFTQGFYSNGTDVTTIGLMTQGANFNWLAADNFKIIFFGEEVPTAVEGIEAKTVATPVAVYTLDGRQSNSLRRGINIVRKADGSVQKVLVK